MRFYLGFFVSELCVNACLAETGEAALEPAEALLAKGRWTTVNVGTAAVHVGAHWIRRPMDSTGSWWQWCTSPRPQSPHPTGRLNRSSRNAMVNRLLMHCLVDV